MNMTTLRQEPPHGQRPAKPTKTVADLLIEMLALSEAELLERIVDLTIELDSYRELAEQAIHALRNLTVELDLLGASYHRLIDEFRFVRERLLREAA